MTITVPRATRDSLIKDPVEVQFYHLTSSSPDAITPTILARMMSANQAQPVAKLSDTALAGQISALGR